MGLLPQYRAFSTGRNPTSPCFCVSNTNQHSTNMKVVVFSAEMGLASSDGEGSKASRLFSLCENRIPECLLPVAGEPILGHQLSLLAEVGLVDIIVVSHKWCADLIRGFVAQKTSDKDGGKVSNLSVEVVTVEPHFCAADTLLLLKPKLDSDFLILNWDILFDPNLLHSLVDKHRIKSSVLTCLFLQQESEKKEKEPKGKGGKGKGHQPTWSFDSLKNGLPFRSIPPRISHYFGLDGDRLLVAVPCEGAGGKADEASSVRFSITKTMLKRFPDITVSRTLADATVYVCSQQVLEFVSANIEGMHRRTFQTDVLPKVCFFFFSFSFFSFSFSFLFPFLFLFFFIIALFLLFLFFFLTLLSPFPPQKKGGQKTIQRPHLPRCRPHDQHRTTPSRHDEHQRREQERKQQSRREPWESQWG